MNIYNLKKVLNEIVHKLIPHQSNCNLVARSGSYGVGCTCSAKDQREHFEELISEIDKSDE
jgi:hypothetical protein